MNTHITHQHPVKTGCFFYQCKLILTGILGTFLSSFFFAFLRQQFIHDSLSNETLYPTIGSIIIAVFISPILEELLFRDWMIPFLKKNGLRYRYAILISACIFAILHFDWWLFPYLVNGIIYGIIKVKSKNGYTSMIVHSAYNALVLLPLLF